VCVCVCLHSEGAYRGVRGDVGLRWLAMRECKGSRVPVRVLLLGVKGKGIAHPRTGHEGPEGEHTYSSTLPLTSAVDVVGGQSHAPAALPPGKPGTHFTGGLVVPRVDLDRYGKSAPPPPPTGIRSPARPARSESL
jgi:hypothetical protein